MSDPGDRCDRCSKQSAGLVLVNWYDWICPECWRLEPEPTTPAPHHPWLEGPTDGPIQ
jgi:hypothetical protein